MTDYVVSSGTTSTGVTLVSHPNLINYQDPTGDTQEVLSGGLAIGTSVGAVSTQTVSTGGAASGSVLDGGQMFVNAGATADATIVAQGDYVIENDNNDYLIPGLNILGTATNTTIDYGASVYIEVGGVATGIADNSTSSVTYEFDEASGPAYGLTVGGSASGVVIGTAGSEIISSGGTTTGTVVNGGSENVASGGTANATILETGTSSVTGVSNNTTVNRGALSVANGGVTNAAVVNSSGSEYVGGGGDAIGSVINAGGTESVSAGGPTQSGYTVVTLPVGRATGLTLSGGGSVANSGVISSNGGIGDAVAIMGGGTITNATSGTITGTGLGVYSDASGPVSITNRGTIEATNAAGVAISLNGVGTITNSGAIVGGSTGTAISGVSHLTLGTGSVITGNVTGAASSTLELAAPTGTLAGLGNQYTGFGTVQLDANDAWTLSGANTLGNGATLALGVGSTLAVAGGALTDAGAGSIAFQGLSTLSLDASTTGLTVTGFDANDKILLSNIVYAATDTVSVVGNVVTVAQANGLNDSISVAGGSGENFALSSVAGGTELTVEPVIALIAAHPDTAGTLAAGNVITFDLTPNVALTTTTTNGVPSLSLSDGGTATFDETASNLTTLVFRSTVVAGQNTSDLKVTGIAFGNSTIVDAAGTSLDLTSVAGLAGSDTGIAIQTTTPVVPVTPVPPPPAPGGLALAAASDSGIVGDGITNVSAALITGTAQAGSTIEVYDNGSATPVGSGIVSGTGSFSVAAALVPGVNSLTATATNAPGSVSAASPRLTVTLENSAPTVTALAATASAVGPLVSGAGVSFTLTPSAPVTINLASGSPTLALSDGGIALFNFSASSATSLVFSTTVLAGQNSANLQVASLSLGGAVIQDVAGNSLNAASIATLAGSNTGIAIQTTPVSVPDTTPPAPPSGLALAASSDTGIAGDGITNASAPVITGTAEAGSTVNLYDNGGSTAVGNGTASATGLFSIVSSIAAGANSLTATATDAASNVSAASSSLAVTLENVAPTVASLTATASASGALVTGSSISFTLTPSAAVSISLAGGSPTLALNDGGTAVFNGPASLATALVFTTTVLSGQNAADLQVTSLSLNGAAIQDVAGNSLDGSAVASLAGSTTGLVVDTDPAEVVAPPVVTTVPGANGATVFSTTAGASNSVTTTATGNDIVNSLGTDTINAGGGTDLVFASGPAATVNGGAGALIFVAGAGNYTAGGGQGADTLYGGNGMSVLTGGAGANSIIVAGFGNTSLVGGAGSSALMFGGFGANVFTGSAHGSDTMVGGNGTNTFKMTNNDIAFGGANGPDTFDTGSGTSLIVEGPGTTSVVFGSGATTDFGGTGADTYTIAKGIGAIANIVGFKATDHLDLTGGFTQADATSAISKAAAGSFGTTLHLTDGTTINLFGVSISAPQIGVA